MGVRRYMLVVVALVLAGLLAGCTRAEPSAQGTATASPTPATDVTASVVQYRRDVPRRVVQIKFTNGGRDDVDITLLDAMLPGYETSPGGVRSNPLLAGRRVDLPVRLGTAICDERVPGTASAAVQVVSGSGSATRLTVPIADENGLLERLREHDCDVQHVEQAVNLELSDTWEHTGSGPDAGVRGHVMVSLRPGTESVRISTAIAGELLALTVLDAQGNPALPIDLDAGRPRADLDLEIIGTRCDGHAIAESRRLMTFSFWVSVDGADPVVLRRSPDLDGYRTLVAALLERCGGAQ